MQSDTYTASISNVAQDEQVVFEIKAFKEDGRHIDTDRLDMYFQAAFFSDPRDGSVYPATQIGHQIWMTANLAWSDSQGYASPGPVPVNGDPSNDADYGLLYQYGDAVNLPATADGWRVPTLSDWQTLTNLIGYDGLQDTSSGSPALVLAGYVIASLPYSSGSFNVISGFTTDAYHWSSTAGTSRGTAGVYCLHIDDVAATVDDEVWIDSQWAGNYATLSVRHVRDVPSLGAAQTEGSGTG